MMFSLVLMQIGFLILGCLFALLASLMVVSLVAQPWFGSLFTFHGRDWTWFETALALGVLLVLSGGSFLLMMQLTVITAFMG